MNDTPDTTIADFFRADPDDVVADFIQEWGRGNSPAGVVLKTDGELVMANGDRNRFATLFNTVEGEYGVHGYDDALDVLDPDSDVLSTSTHASVADAFEAACTAIGCPITKPVMSLAS